jgi:hypothetical protein
MSASRNLLYLASGSYHPIYEQLNFDNIYLVDHKFGNNQNGNSDSKVKIIAKDALLAIDELKSKNIRFDAVVSLNDGMLEGGGTYPIFSDAVLGYLNPLLRDEVLVITDLKYQGSIKLARSVSKMQFGFDALKLNSTSPDFLHPSLFCNSMQQQNNFYDNDFGDIYKLSRSRKESCFKLHNGLKIKLIKDSIWRDEQNLDLLGLNIDSKQALGGQRGRGIKSVNDFFFNSKSNTLQIRGKSFEQILQICLEKNVRTLGLCPWLKGQYKALFEALNSKEAAMLDEISFYHIRNTDFKELYNCLASANLRFS